jgi:rod shape-determining protein MreC
MMRPSKQTLGMFALAGIVTAVGFLVLMGVGALASWNVHGRGLSVASTFTGNMVRALDSFVRGFSGEDETMELRRANARLLSQLAGLRDVEEENTFLRRIADIPVRKEYRSVIGGVFNYSVAGSELRMVLNVGARDGVVVGSTVVTETGAFLGIVKDVRERSSVVLVLGDPSVQVTGRVMDSQVGGLIRMDQTGQLAFELIGKDESVSEGAVIVASGLDSVPAGLRIGTVRSVDAARTTLFQIIRVDPAYRDETVWRVLVLIP